MTDKARLQALLDIATLTEEYEALRPKVESDKQKPADMERYRELNDQIAAARTAFKEQFPAEPTSAPDAAATPASVNAKTK